MSQIDAEDNNFLDVATGQNDGGSARVVPGVGASAPLEGVAESDDRGSLEGPGIPDVFGWLASRTARGINPSGGLDAATLLREP